MLVYPIRVYPISTNPIRVCPCGADATRVSAVLVFPIRVYPMLAGPVRVYPRYGGGGVGAAVKYLWSPIPSEKVK